MKKKAPSTHSRAHYDTRTPRPLPPLSKSKMIKTDQSKPIQDKFRPVQVGLRVLEEPFSIEMRFLWS